MIKVEFGKIKVRDKVFDTDVRICVDKNPEEREKSHTLTESEMEELLLEDPELVVVGTGFNGGMKVSEGAVEAARRNGTALFISKTPEAVEFYRSISGKRVSALFHITC